VTEPWLLVGEQLPTARGLGGLLKPRKVRDDDSLQPVVRQQAGNVKAGWVEVDKRPDALGSLSNEGGGVARGQQ